MHENLAGFEEGERSVRFDSFKEFQSSKDFIEETLPRLGYLNAPIGGLITNPGNTVLKDNSVSRKGILPKLDKELCFNCGYCDMVCPDYCFVWDKNVDSPDLIGIDYQFCKGCQKCIVACPVNALVPVREKEVSSQERSYKVFPGVNVHTVSENWHKVDWSQQVAELSEQERMLTIQTELLDPNSYIRPDFSKHIFPQKKKQDENE